MTADTLRFVPVLVVGGLLICVPGHTAVAEPNPYSRSPYTSTPEAAQSTETSATHRKSRFLPIPIFITEPAIGAGLGVALAYFHKPRASDPATDDSLTPAITVGKNADAVGTQQRPPTVSGIAAAYTENGTWGVGIGHTNSWRDDTIRYSGTLGYTHVESTFFRFDIAINFDIDGGIAYQDLKFRIGESDFFLGGKLSYLGAKTRIDLGGDRSTDLGEGRIVDAGLAAQGVYDTRDNVLTPNRGQLVELNTWRYDSALGGDFDYWRLGLNVNSFHSFRDRYVLAWRIETQGVNGSPPFWAYPWVTLRGIPALRYQNERVGVAELELRYDIFERWGVLGFVGKGETDGNNPAFETEDNILAGGVGGRYLFDRALSLWVGVDLARGPEDGYAYIQVGHAW